MSMVVKDSIFNTSPGAGINANPFEGEMYIDITSPLGALTGMYYSLMFQLGKLGFMSMKIDEWIDVTPAFKAYYDLTIQQKQALEAQVKSGLQSISTAIHDYELIWHDLRKYREYMDYFTKIEEGHHLKKRAKTKDEKEKAEQVEKEGMQLLRSVFVDQVDAHTGEGIALRTITQRWPTIIVDFFRLDDSDKDPKKIASRYGFTEAEGAVLITKNKLFIEWRDNLFKPTLKERYQNVLRLVEARKTSIKQYTEMLRPVIARFKIITDALERPGQRAFNYTSFFQPAAQSYSTDFTHIWSIQPFAPVEKYQVTKEYLDEISGRVAGFTKDEIKILEANGKNVEDIKALPVEPSIDNIVRRYLPQVNKHFGVNLNIVDVFEARQRLVTQFETRATEATPALAGGGGVSFGARWLFSPYFIFLEIPFYRFVFKGPDGGQFEDLFIQNLTVQTRTQNVIIVNLLEIIARERQLENYISQLVGELGGPDLKTIEEIAKGQYPEFFGVEKKEGKKKEPLPLGETLTKTKSIFGDVMDAIGKNFGVRFDWLRARGPYEFAMDDRIAQMYQREVMAQGFGFVLRYLQQAAGVPGVKV